jgi:hypothetical protein
MKNWQYEDLLAAYQAGKTNRLYVAQGSHKGAVGDIVEIDEKKRKITVDIGKDVPVSLIYTHFDEVDETGQPVIKPHRDTTGRLIKAGHYVTFIGKKTYNSKEKVLMIGKISRFTDAGLVEVVAVAKHGAVLQDDPHSYFTKHRYTVDPMKVMRIPVEEKDLILWKMQDFETLGVERRKASDAWDVD